MRLWLERRVLTEAAVLFLYTTRTLSNGFALTAIHGSVISRASSNLFTVASEHKCDAPTHKNNLMCRFHMRLAWGPFMWPLSDEPFSAFWWTFGIMNDSWGLIHESEVVPQTLKAETFYTITCTYLFLFCTNAHLNNVQDEIQQLHLNIMLKWHKQRFKDLAKPMIKTALSGVKHSSFQPRWVFLDEVTRMRAERWFIAPRSLSKCSCR